MAKPAKSPKLRKVILPDHLPPEPKVHHGGYPSSLTPEVKVKLLQALRAGNYRDAACAFAGVSRRSFYEWKSRAEKETSGMYVEFMADVERAELEGQAHKVILWQGHMPHDYRAIRDFMALRYPAGWARRDIVTHDLPAQPSPVYDLSKLTPEEWEQFTALRKKLMTPDPVLT
jgi:hypothetical protein